MIQRLSNALGLGEEDEWRPLNAVCCGDGGGGAYASGGGWRSIKDFGAVGNGVADDTAAFQAAVNSVTKIFLPPGTYNIDGTVLIRTCLKIV